MPHRSRLRGRCGIPQVPVVVRVLGSVGDRHTWANRIRRLILLLGINWIPSPMFFPNGRRRSPSCRRLHRWFSGDCSGLRYLSLPTGSLSLICSREPWSPFPTPSQCPGELQSALVGPSPSLKVSVGRLIPSLSGRRSSTSVEPPCSPPQSSL